MNIKDIVKDNRARFVRYRQGIAFYGVKFEGIEYTFPVPLNDIGDATLHADEKALMLMRYIRKALEDGTFVPLDETEAR